MTEEKAPRDHISSINGNELANHLGELGSGGNTVAGAAALGSVDGTLADAAAQAQGALGSVATGGGSVGGGAGRGDIGSGTPADTGDLGGGGAEGTMHGTASPGGDGRA